MVTTRQFFGGNARDAQGQNARLRRPGPVVPNAAPSDMSDAKGGQIVHETSLRAGVRGVAGWLTKWVERGQEGSGFNMMRIKASINIRVMQIDPQRDFWRCINPIIGVAICGDEVGVWQ